MKMLEKDRDIRCQTASELRRDLKRVKPDLDRSDRSNRSERSAAFEPLVVAPSTSVSANAPAGVLVRFAGPGSARQAA